MTTQQPQHDQENQLIELYGLFCPRSGELRYIGKSVNAKQRLKGHIADASRKELLSSCWIKGLLADGLRPEMRVLAKVREDEWQEAERALIAGHRTAGTRLLNVADGGEAPAFDRKVSAENGRKNAKARDPRMWRMFQRMGAEAKHFEKKGNVELAQKLRRAVAAFKTVSHEKQQAFLDAHPNWCTN